MGGMSPKTSFFWGGKSRRWDFAALNLGCPPPIPISPREKPIQVEAEKMDTWQFFVTFLVW